MDAVEILSELIALPSLNPGDTENASFIGEERVAKFLEKRLGKLGFAVERVEYLPGRDNVVWRLDTKSAKRVLMIEGHMDTVAVDGMVVDPFRATVKNGRLYGRGACDTKGPIAAALAALTPRVLEAAKESNRGLMFVAACAEEKGCFGAKSLADHGVGADEAIVLEPTELAPVVAHKGSTWFHIQLTGRACHGSEPENGVNAVEAGCEVVRFLKEDLRFQQGPDERLGVNTINVGKMSGGRAANIVPHQCTLEVDIRTVPSEDTTALVDQMRDFLEHLKTTGRVVDAEWKVTVCPSFATSTQSDLVQRMVRSGAGEPTGTAWMSDACPLSRTCEEIAVFGPGSIRQAHTKDEFIELKQLQRGVEMFEAIYLDFLNGDQ